MTEATAALNDHDFLNALMNLVIPPSASGDLPGAGTLGLSPTVAEALQADPLLGPMVETGAQAVREAALAEHPDGLRGMAPQAATEVLKAGLTSHPFLIMGLSRYLYPAYYQHPRVLEAIGEPPRPPFPEGFDLEATDAELLEILRSRRRTQ